MRLTENKSELGASGGVRPRTFTLKGREFSEEQVASVGNHFFQTLAKMASRLKQVLAKLK
jgi:hypothetical protein